MGNLIIVSLQVLPFEFLTLNVEYWAWLAYGPWPGPLPGPWPWPGTMKPSPSQLINSIDHVRPYWYTNYKQNNYYTTISKCKWQQHMGSALNIVLFQMNQLRFKMVVSGSLNANIPMFAGEILWVNTSLSGLRLHLILSIECLRLKLCWKSQKIESLSSSAPAPAPFQSGQCQNSKNSFEVNVSNLRLKFKKKKEQSWRYNLSAPPPPPPETF